MSTIFSEKGYPKYEVHFLGVGDADAIIVWYQQYSSSSPQIAVIDAGNVDDSTTIKNFLWNRWRTLHINLAVCTHPDKDHKGGFFNLFEDKSITIDEFWYKDPYNYISDDDFAKMKKQESKEIACSKIYNHPSDGSKNLLIIVASRETKMQDVSRGLNHAYIPLSVLGPCDGLYREAAKGIVGNFAELTTDPNLKPYDETAQCDEQSAKSMINGPKDLSYTNIGSIVLLFEPKPQFKILLAGDASCNSLREIYNSYTNRIKKCILKVPHHGSINNLDTDLIDDIEPYASVISCAGNEKHPNNSIVYYLSKYGHVYSTHKTPGLYYTSEPHTSSASPFKKKIGT